ncbi:hypothetical protein PQJ75_14135 [Rhodoplanes sp. TEM]|uniref:Sugar ABC transporter ATP-binding protein n=1 Tax=Rhodoplanes tepidamans TaxID=200616 RepID=A0ABT5JK44_RHOTP|nr:MULTISPECIES: hypothetical protein [Rhodoplanes]MDC7789863.1 hypothetical protein [Rhodoplanes tepidamans]MDC7984872.1 hypothetical protein [Rhodoplanes sp. TEM]MDQ0358461.1 hypothetical protein [Rhodoplanes tepidamans]
MSKHLKTKRPLDTDLDRNPMIGGSKGLTMAGVDPNELDDLAGATTIEGDVENDVNRQGGVDKAAARDGRGAPHK